jgi:hypothetical protein
MVIAKTRSVVVRAEIWQRPHSRTQKTFSANKITQLLGQDLPQNAAGGFTFETIVPVLRPAHYDWFARSRSRTGCYPI